MFNVVATPKPFKTDHVLFELENDNSIDHVLCELVDRTGIDPTYLRAAFISVNEVAIPKCDWSKTYPGEGGRVIIIAAPDAVAIPLLIQVAGVAASSFVGGLGFGALTTFALKAAITIGTTLLAQALTPGPKKRLSSGGSAIQAARASVTGTQNATDPYGYVPKHYGRTVNYHPPLAAHPYIEMNGSDQRLRMLFCVGMGPLQITNLKIGDTPISNYTGIVYEIRQGYETDTPTGLFPSQVTDETLSIRLKQAGGFHTRLTAPETDEIFVRVSFPNGLNGKASNGANFHVLVQFQLNIREVGGSWYAPVMNATSSHVSGVGGGLFAISGGRTDATHGELRINVPRGQYEVRVRRVSVDDQSDNQGEFQTNTQENSFWTALRSHKNEDPVLLPGVALVAVVVKANDQLAGVIDAFNCTVEAMLPVYNGSAWTAPQVTRNPAYAYVDMLTGNGNARPVSLDRIDIDAIYAWGNDCILEPRTFDGVFNSQSTVFDAMHDAGATGRAGVAMDDGLFSIIQGKQQTEVVAHISPRNSWDFKGVKLIGDLPHGLKVRFPNELTLHQVDEIIVYDDGYNETNATKLEVLDLPFTTNALQAAKDGRFALASAKHRPGIFSCSMDMEFISFKRGDLVQVVNDVALMGISSARVKGVLLDGSSNATAITVDAPLPMEAGTEYGIRIRKRDRQSIVHQVDTVDGEQVSLTFSTPIPSGDAMPEIGDLVLYGELGRESVAAIIRSIEPQDDLTAIVTYVQDSDLVWTADQGFIGDFDPGITLQPDVNPPTPPAPIITSVQSDEAALLVNNDGSLDSQILIGLIVSSFGGGALIGSIQARYRVAMTEDKYLSLPLYPGDTDRISIRPVQDGETYEIQIRVITDAGAVSPWAEQTHKVIGQTTPPPDVEAVFRNGGYLTWAYPNPPLDHAGFVARTNLGTGQSWNAGDPLFDGIITESRLDISNLTGTRTVSIRAIDRAGNVSLTSAIVTLNLGDPNTDNLLLEQDEDGDGFTGTKVNGTVASGELLADASSEGLFWTNDNNLFWHDDADLFYPSSVYHEMQYTAFYEVLTAHIGATIKLRLTVTGADYIVEYRTVNDPLFWSTDGATFWNSDTDSFWNGSVGSAWTLFNGEIGPLTTDEFNYEFRVTTVAGQGRGTIENFDILIDVPDIREEFDDVAIAASGTVRLPITETYREIVIVHLTVQDDGVSTAVFAKAFDKNHTLGPEIRCFDINGTRVAGNIDADVKGY